MRICFHGVQMQIHSAKLYFLYILSVSMCTKNRYLIFFNVQAMYFPESGIVAGAYSGRRCRCASAQYVNIFNFRQLFGAVDSEKQVMFLAGGATFFKMHLPPEKMQVVHFRKALLAFLPRNSAFLPRNRRAKPTNKGQTAAACPCADAKIRNFPAESKKC